MNYFWGTIWTLRTLSLSKRQLLRLVRQAHQPAQQPLYCRPLSKIFKLKIIINRSERGIKI